MQNFQNLNSFFTPEVQVTEKKGQVEFYKPSVDKGKGGTYQSVIRFVSWHENPNTPYIHKYECWLEHPLTGTKKGVDCPSSVGQQSIIYDTYWRLKNSKSAVDQENAEKLNRKPRYYALVQVINDENDKSLEGKILIWSFGKKVYEKINAALNPVSAQMPKENPFDIINGRPFSLIITKVSGFANYDQSGFFGMEGRAPLKWDVVNEGQFVDMTQPVGDDVLNKVIAEAYANNAKIKEMLDGMLAGAPLDLSAFNPQMKSQLAIFAYVVTKSPDMKKMCGFREWDEETKAFVNDVIRSATGSMPVATANVVNYGSVPQPQVQPQAYSQPQAQPQSYSQPQVYNNPIEQPQAFTQNVVSAQVAAPQMGAAPMTGMGDLSADIDKLLNEFGQ